MRFQGMEWSTNSIHWQSVESGAIQNQVYVSIRFATLMISFVDSTWEEKQ